MSVLSAAEVRFSATVDRNEVELGDRITLTVTVEGSGSGSLPTPQLPQLDGFDNLGSTRSSSTNIALIGGRVTQSVSHDFIWVLEPRRVGTLTIGPCHITIAGKEYATQPISITVTKASGGRRAPSSAGAQPNQPRMYDPFGLFGFPEPPARRPAGRVEDNVELVASVDRTSVWQGEQLVVTYTFYTAEEIRSLSLTQSPTLSGFWVENLYEPSQLEYQPVNRGGRRVYAATLRRSLLLPTRAGELTVDPIELSGTVLRGGGFFGFEEVPFRIASRPIKVAVRPLPDSGRPVGFCGGVGEFRVNASLSRDTSIGGEPLNLTITLAGTGNLGLIAAPAAPELPGVKVLAPETRDDFSRANNRLSGTRSFVYPLIPQIDGRHVIPGQVISFFNPKTGQYYGVSTPQLDFIAMGTPTAGGAGRDAGMRLLGTDIAHIKYRLHPVPAGWDRVWWSDLLYPVGLLVFGVGAVVGRHRRRLDTDRGYARRMRASRVLKKSLKEAGALIGERTKFYAALNRALVGFIGDRYNLEAAGMTNEQLTRELGARGVSSEALAELIELVNLCDAGRFAPEAARHGGLKDEDGGTECAPQRLLVRARTLLEKLG